MSLTTVIERSKRERENWRYTDVEKILGASFRRKPEAQKNPLPLAGRVREGGVQHSSRLGSHPETSGQALRPLPQPLPQGEGGFARLVFIDGIWQPEQSRLGDLPPGIMQGDTVRGYRLVLEGQTCLITSPVELHFITTDAAATETAVKLHIQLGASGRLTLIERHETAPRAVAVATGAPAPGAEQSRENNTTTHVMETEITLHPQAKLVHGKIIASGAEQAHLAMTRAHIAEGAFYDNFTLIRGGRLTRNEIEAKLEGKMAQCTLNGAMLLRNHEHADTTTRIIHAAPYGTSRQVYKSIVDGQSRAVFQGKIIVAEDAQKTDGYQLSRALLLSDQAEMDAKPELEIHADDVKCSHGSTVGDLDADALFYLRARGLSETEARGLLIRAFVGEILDEIHVPEWRESCRAEVEGWLDEQS